MGSCFLDIYACECACAVFVFLIYVCVRSKCAQILMSALHEIFLYTLLLNTWLLPFESIDLLKLKAQSSHKH